MEEESSGEGEWLVLRHEIASSIPDGDRTETRSTPQLPGSSSGLGSLRHGDTAAISGDIRTETQIAPQLPGPTLDPGPTLSHSIHTAGSIILLLFI